MKVKMLVAAVTFLVVCLMFTYLASAAEEIPLIVVANDANYELAQPWVTFMKSEAVPFKRILPSDFDQYKKEKYIAILGGPGEMDNTGNVVKQLLTKEDLDFVTQAGNSRMYVKSNVWNPGQQIIIFAGSDKQASACARTNSRERWMTLFSNWYGLDLAGHFTIPSLDGGNGECHGQTAGQENKGIEGAEHDFEFP